MSKSVPEVKHKHDFELRQIGAPDSGHFEQVCKHCGLWKEYV